MFTDLCFRFVVVSVCVCLSLCQVRELKAELDRLSEQREQLEKQKQDALQQRTRWQVQLRETEEQMQGEQQNRARAGHALAEVKEQVSRLVVCVCVCVCVCVLLLWGVLPFLRICDSVAFPVLCAVWCFAVLTALLFSLMHLLSPSLSPAGQESH